MRTARRVISCLLILSAGAFLTAQQSGPPAQGSVDTDVTVTGSDDAVIPIPQPVAADGDLVLPLLDADVPQAFIVPPIMPPAGSVQPRPDPGLPPADARALLPPRSGSK